MSDENVNNEVNQESPAASGKEMLAGEGKSAVLAAILSAVCLGGLGQLYLGQSTKGIILIIASLLLGAAGGVGVIVWVIGIYEAWAIGKKLEAGQPVEKNEWEIDFLNNIFNK